jgi:hypothetical protein
MSKIPSKCPSCGSRMVITQIGCTTCDTVIMGNYQLSAFARLSAEQLQFLEVFVRNRGNLKEMERETGDSYWAMRSLLDKIVEEMGYEAETSAHTLAARRKEILLRLSAGEIDAAEAARLLTQLGK